MKKTVVSAIALLTLISAQSASAHEQRVLDLNGTLYHLVVGSLNEPVVVDDRSGLDLQVHKIGARAKYEALVKAGDIPEKTAAVTGLEETLKADIFVDSNVKQMELSKVWGEDGKYKTLFYPTSVATIGYRIYGTIDGVEVNETFICNPAGHIMKPKEEEHVMEDGSVMAGHEMKPATAMNDNVVFSDGSFGCPKPKADFGFPAQAEEHDDDNARQLITLALAALAFGMALNHTLRARTHRHDHSHDHPHTHLHH